jgi:hypothetical protein
MVDMRFSAMITLQFFWRGAARHVAQLSTSVAARSPRVSLAEQTGLAAQDKPVGTKWRAKTKGLGWCLEPRSGPRGACTSL